MIKLFLLFCIFNNSNTLAININRKPNIKNIDDKIFKVAKPATLNHLMEPILGIVDGFWVSKLGNSQKLGGQGCADQIFNTFYRFIDFFPYILAPEVTKLNAQNKTQEIENIYSNILSCSIIITTITSFLIFNFTNFIVKIFIKKENLIYDHAINYLKIRVLGLPFTLTNSIIFAVLRGLMDYKSALYINFKCQLFNLIGDPIFMKLFDIKGLAFATILSEIFCTIQYIELLNKKKIYFKFNTSLKKLIEIFRKTIFVQLKNIAHNLLIIITNNKITRLDYTGKQVAAHILTAKLFDFGCIFSRGLHSVSSVMISNELVFNNDKQMKKRLFFWSNVIGVSQLLLFLNIKFILPFFTSDIIVIEQCKKLTYILSLIGYSGCLLNTMDGIMQGYQKFTTQAIITTFSLFIMLSLMIFSQSLLHIWSSYFIISLIRIFLMYKFI